ncbi:MAG TPA: thermonuclease family protein [Patescibacteria group bacterium]|nr:thermonuclease family protein [Patescibacteria group bacterium]
MKKQIYSIIVGLALIVFAIYSKQHAIPSPKEQVSGTSQIQLDKSIKTIPGQPIKIARVVDGDTIELINGERLRYIGIDTPEEVDPQKPGVQCYAREAAERNRELVEGHTITFQKDVSTYDKYGRWLGFVYLEDGTMVNEELVKGGFAFSYPYKPDIGKQDLFNADEAEAKAAKQGLWGVCTVTSLSTGREQTNWLQ